MRRFFRILVSLLVLVLLGLLGWLYQPLPENPSSAQLAESATRYQAEVFRDQWGVPHITGQRDADVSFGLAFAHAEDDYETIQEVVAATRGVLASYKGRAAAPTDYIVSLLDVWGILERRYQRDVPDDVKAIARGYAAGLNLYASQNPEDTWRGLAPFKAEDVIAGFVFKTPFFYGLDDVLLKLFDESRQPDLALDPSATETAFQFRERSSGAELGSNAIAVNRSRSGDASTRLLINSHQPMTGPVAWYEAHVKSEQGLEMTGGLFPGTPLILHGFNPYLGWANTVNHIDLSDVFVLQRNPDNENQYRLDGEWRDFEIQEVSIDVRLWGPLRFPAKRRVLRTVHGPVVEGSNGDFAIRYAGMGEIRQLEQYYRLNQAKNFNQFLSAMAMNALPSINYVYADKEDNIAFIHNAQYPRRKPGIDWRKDLPGDDSELVWQGYLEFNRVPKLVNPQSGLLFNANNTPFLATDGPDNLRATDFPAFMGLASNQTNRALRLKTLSKQAAVIGKRELLQIKFDDDYSPESDQYRLVQKIAALSADEMPDLALPLKIIRQWNRSTDRDNPHAALVILTLRRILRGPTPDDHSAGKLHAALATTVEHMMQTYGRLDVPWGEVNRLVRGGVNLPLDGGPDVLRAIYSYGLPEGEIAYATHGDTWMALVEWDESGDQRADLLHQYGSATLNVESKHYADQAPLFANKQWRRALLDWSEIESTAQRRYVIGGREP